MQSLQRVAANLKQEFSEQIQWRFENLTKFKWIDLVHPAKFGQRGTATVNNQRALISELKELYQFVVPDTVALEQNLAVLFPNKEISALIRQLVRERDALVAKKKEELHTRKWHPRRKGLMRLLIMRNWTPSIFRKLRSSKLKREYLVFRICLL